MPTLTDAPPSLPDGVLSVADLSGRFVLAMVKGRHEKEMVRSLAVHGIGFYLPLCQVEGRAGRRRYVTEKPLIGGYVFACGDGIIGTVREIGYAHGHLLSTVIVPDGAQGRLRSDLLNLETALIKSNGRVDFSPEVVAGRRCRIASGKFQGIEGVVIRRPNSMVVVLGIKGVLGSIEMTIDIADVEPIEAAAA